MARIRSIKPELRTSITVSSWPFEVRYFFVLLWGYLDDYGRGVDDELLIAADCFPRDRHITPDTVDAWLELIADSGPLCRYEVDGRRYLHCPNWREHQKPQHPTPSRNPPCPDDEPDGFDEWRRNHPERLTKRSRRSREELRKISPAFSGAARSAIGDASAEGVDVADALIIPMPGQLAIGEVNPSESTGQVRYGSPHESLMSDSGNAPAHFTPEQGAGSREMEIDRSAQSGTEPAPPKHRRATAGKPTAKRATPAPDDFTITEPMRTWATAKGIPAGQIDRQTERFLNHHQSKGNTFKDWNAAWRNWMDRAVEYAPRQATGTTGPSYDPVERGVF